MKRNNILFILLFLIPLRFFSQEQTASLPIIPYPKECKLSNGNFTLTPETKIIINLSTPKTEIEFFNNYLASNYGFSLQTSKTIPLTGNYIQFEIPEWEAGYKENYHLTIDEKHISILAEGKSAGVFYALQTLIQILPIEKNKSLKLPCVAIKDSPRFEWRGMHLDVCRHFFPISFVKKYIDLLAMYKMNTFHWHLTDDQGWRIEIKKYPKLTETGASRKGTMIGPYKDQKFDSIPYGGFYTQEQIKEVVTYAEKKHITIVPEIEMPGHSVAAISSYPWLSCTGKQIEVEKAWGVFEDVYCTKDSVFNFLQDVMDEVVTLFPGKYIHIGGDESPKTRWKVCANCQARIKSEHLKDEHELQSYFIKRIEKYLNTKGKQIIGWNEILEGGLAPNAAVMSWQGTEGGIAAAKQKHYAVMTPGSHCYFDHYQASPADEPLAFGGYTPLEKVYSYEPIPSELNEDEQHYILGAQANIWTEYILDEKQVEYMLMPRMMALSEVVWSPKENRNETDFLNRLQTQFLLLDKLGINYAKAIYKVEQKVNSSKKPNSIELELIANPSLGTIYYTTDDSDPKEISNQYKAPITISKNVTIRAALYKNKELKGKISVRNYNINKATNKPITLKTPASKSYSGEGNFTLVNGVVASLPRISNQWLGFNGNDLEATINLEKTDAISEITVGFLKEELSWIYLPKEIEYFISMDGTNFTSVGKVSNNEISNERFATLQLKLSQAKYIKVIAKNFGKIPSGKPGAGEDAWLFCDEIQIK
ncbi:MAG: family 20 glycosylhydrolase [Bacteroidia bacterium]